MAEYIKKWPVVDKLTALENELQQYKPFRPCESTMYRRICDVEIEIGKMDAEDVAPVVHGRCEVCQGKSVITQDCDNGYSVEVDGDQSELSVWYGDRCLAVFSIDYCQNCGAKMDLEEPNETKES